MDEALKKELLGAVDESIKSNLESIVGTQVAEKVAETVKQMRLERVLTGRDVTGLDAETKLSFVRDIRSIARGEKAAFLEQSDQSGGYLVQSEVFNGILRIAATTGIVARDARKFPIGSDELEIPRYTGGVLQGEFVGEDQEGNETNVDIGVTRLHPRQWMVIFRVSNVLLADASVDIADWFLSLVAEGLAYRLDREGFVGGTFVGSPFVGLLASADVTTQTMAATKTGFDKFDLDEASIAIGTLPTAALNDAAFYLNRTAWARIRTQKDGNGRYVFNTDYASLLTQRKADGIQPVGEILGYPVYTPDVLPTYSNSAINTKFGVFANLNLALFWGERGPMEIAKSTDATVGGKSLFRANETAFRITDRFAVGIGLPAAAVVFKTAAS